MSLLSIFLAILPILVIFVLLILRRMPADIAGFIGWAVTLLTAWLYFETPLPITLQISLAGVIASFPITLMVAASLLQVFIMIEAGAISRIVAFIKSIAPYDQIVQIMIINFGFGTLLAALGATPVSILPPIMVAMGYSSFVAIALPAIGYDALCTYALLGVPVVVFSSFVGLPIDEVGTFFARFMPYVSTCIALGMLWIVGRWKLVWKGLIPALLSGLSAGLITIGMDALNLIPLTGVAAGLGVVVVMLIYLKATRKVLWDKSVLNEEDREVEKAVLLRHAVSPWIILVVFAILVNLPALPFYELTFTRLSMPVEIITGAPEKLRLFWQAYFWIFMSTLLALPFLKPTTKQVSTAIKKWIKRAPRPMLASAVFFAIAYILNHSGKNVEWELIDPNNNMVAVLANASASAFDWLYPLVAPYLGLLTGFISGSETSSIAMLTTLHLSTAEKIGAIGLLIAAASGIGGGLASVISPAKLQNASASIGKIGEEASVLRITFIIAVIITAAVSALSILWSF